MPESFIVYQLRKLHPEPPHANTHVLTMNDVANKDSLSFCTDLSLDDTFSVYLPKHRKLAASLLFFLMEVRDPRVLMEYLVYLHDRCNPYMFNYVMSVLILNRVDELQFIMPDYFHMFPELFINGGSYNKALTAMAVEPTEIRSIILIEDQFTSTRGDPELRLNYFREDIALNLFHVIYTRLYPTDGPVAYVNKRRRGEIFYYVYQQLIARYNVERLCNGMTRVKRLQNFTEPIKETCFPKLNSKTTNSNWPPRMSDCTIGDLDRYKEDILCDVSGLERWRDRIIDAIDNGFMILVRDSKELWDYGTGINIVNYRLTAGKWTTPQDQQ